VQDFKNELLHNPIVLESLQLFNVWNFPNRDKRYGLDFKGAIPGQIVENVLYYFTEPFDVVVDPMAGGGTTIDVCKAWWLTHQAEPLC
jgi:DNA modification methylase